MGIFVAILQTSTRKNIIKKPVIYKDWFNTNIKSTKIFSVSVSLNILLHHKKQITRNNFSINNKNDHIDTR